MSTGVERLDPYGDRSEPAWAGRRGRARRLPGIAVTGMASTPARATPKAGEMALQLSDERRERLIQSLEGFYLQEFDETLSQFRAGRLLDHVLESVAPHVYNQAVQDARAFMQRKLDELDGEVTAGGSCPGLSRRGRTHPLPPARCHAFCAPSASPDGPWHETYW